MRYVLRFLRFVFVSLLRRNDVSPYFVLLLLHILIQFIPNLTASWAREKIAQTYVRSLLLLLLLRRFLSHLVTFFSVFKNDAIST